MWGMGKERHVALWFGGPFFEFLLGIKRIKGWSRHLGGEGSAPLGRGDGREGGYFKGERAEGGGREGGDSFDDRAGLWR